MTELLATSTLVASRPSGRRQRTSMHDANGLYSHRPILANYAGVDVNIPLPGILEHGWNNDLGGALSDLRLPMPDPFFVWSHRNLRACLGAGLSHAQGIGAPWLYMPPPPLHQAPQRSLLAIPLHSWEKVKIPQDFENYAQALAQIAGQFSQVTVSLYWFDHQDPVNRETFEKRGFRVVTAGHRDNNPHFLRDMRQMLLGHTHVTSNRAQTGLFYGLHLGLKGFLYGPSAGVEATVDRSGDMFAAWQEREFPMLLWKNFQDDAQPQVASDELGADLQLSPQALRDKMLWNPDQQMKLLNIAWQFYIRSATSRSSLLLRRWQAHRGLAQRTWRDRFRIA